MPSKIDVKCKRCPKLIGRRTRSGMCSKCYYAWRAEQVPDAKVLIDRQLKHTRAEHDDLRRKYDAALNSISKLERELSSMGMLGDSIDTYNIKAKHPSKTSEATPILVASDWHIDEVVTLAQTSGLNQFNPEICKQRVDRFWSASLNLIKNHLAPGVTINTVVLALLGDFINNHLHEEAAETNSALPMHAVVQAEQYLASGLEHFLKNSPYDFVIPCKSGNHGRVTKKTRFATESGHSLEYLIYMHLAHCFRHEPRLRFQINDGYHDYLNIYDRVVRLHHGHAINYQGGIGGIFIPAFKSISQWDKARPADVDVFGHFHQDKDGGKFLSNGSLVGYNSYAVSIKADYEPPKQTLFMIDKKRGRTCKWPVLLA
jgi:hypothetical protein